MNSDELDPLLHDPARIRILSRLYAHEGLRFARLRDLSGLTAGNLHSHLASLERAGHVVQVHGLFFRTRGKLVRMTTTGRHAYEQYVFRLERLVSEMSREIQESKGRVKV